MINGLTWRHTPKVLKSSKKLFWQLLTKGKKLAAQKNFVQNHYDDDGVVNAIKELMLQWTQLETSAFRVQNDLWAKVFQKCDSWKIWEGLGFFGHFVCEFWPFWRGLERRIFCNTFLWGETEVKRIQLQKYIQFLKSSQLTVLSTKWKCELSYPWTRFSFWHFWLIEMWKPRSCSILEVRVENEENWKSLKEPSSHSHHFH